MQKIPVGISSCLLGQEVRFDGGHKRDAYITGTLSRYFEFQPYCPEVAIGLGVPRPTLRLVQATGGVRCIGIKNPERDVTEALRAYAEELRTQHAGLCGYILKKGSPSCGMERVKVYHGEQASKDGVGIYAEALMREHPLLPVEEEGRLGDPGLRENFIQRVFVLYRWRQMIENELSLAGLTRFHARHKLIIMSRGDYRELGQLLANADKDALTVVADAYISQLMRLLRKVPTRSRHVNVLQHIQGYLKKDLSVDDKAELVEVIECYRRGDLPLIVPITLLKHHFRKAPDPYIDESYYMSPYPQELRLLNEL